MCCYIQTRQNVNVNHDRKGRHDICWQIEEIASFKKCIYLGCGENNSVFDRNKNGFVHQKKFLLTLKISKGQINKESEQRSNMSKSQEICNWTAFSKRAS